MIPCTKIFKGESSVHTEKKFGPLVVWNLTSRCNLRCRHCYRDSVAASDSPELSDAKCLELVGQIQGLNPPIVLLSGGEPLLRENIFTIIRACKEAGMRVGLSTNGTFVTREMARAISRSMVDYVGISIDGTKEAHDTFRGLRGAYEKSWEGVRLLNALGVKTGVRFTLTKANAAQLMDILDETVRSGCKRFCLYHLVYAGRAGQAMDLSAQDKKACMEAFFRKVKELSVRVPDFEVLTTDNPADGLFLSQFIDNAVELSCITSHGGCSAGERIVYLDSTGAVYPCQFLREQPIGSVLEKDLREIWRDTHNPFLHQLRNKKDLLSGKCGECIYTQSCAGCRARAKAYHGSLWADDPACYLEAGERKNGIVSCCS